MPLSSFDPTSTFANSPFFLSWMSRITGKLTTDDWVTLYTRFKSIQDTSVSGMAEKAQEDIQSFRGMAPPPSFTERGVLFSGYGPLGRYPHRAPESPEDLDGYASVPPDRVENGEQVGDHRIVCVTKTGTPVYRVDMWVDHVIQRLDRENFHRKGWYVRQDVGRGGEFDAIETARLAISNPKIVSYVKAEDLSA